MGVSGDYHQFTPVYPKFHWIQRREGGHSNSIEQRVDHPKQREKYLVYGMSIASSGHSFAPAVKALVRLQTECMSATNQGAARTTHETSLRRKRHTFCSECTEHMYLYAKRKLHRSTNSLAIAPVQQPCLCCKNASIAWTGTLSSSVRGLALLSFTWTANNF